MKQTAEEATIIKMNAGHGARRTIEELQRNSTSLVSWEQGSKAWHLNSLPFGKSLRIMCSTTSHLLWTKDLEDIASHKLLFCENIHVAKYTTSRTHYLISLLVTDLLRTAWSSHQNKQQRSIEIFRTRWSWRRLMSCFRASSWSWRFQKISAMLKHDIRS